MATKNDFCLLNLSVLTFQESCMTDSKCHAFSLNSLMAVCVSYAAAAWERHTLTSALLGLYRPTD